MSSLKMTFSLTSLILIFALAFAAMPVLAAPGGPTVVSITEYDGNETSADNTGAPHVQKRDNFRVKVTFSHAVGTPTNADVSLIGFNADGAVGTATDAGDVDAITASDGKEYVANYNLSSITEATSVRITIAADVVNGSNPADAQFTLGNQPGTEVFELPPIHTDVTASFGAPTATAGVAGNYTVLLTFDNGTTDEALALSPAFDDNTYIEISPDGAATVTLDAAGVDITTDGKGTITLTIQLGFGVSEADPATISISSSYVKDGASITLPMATQPDPVYQNPPAVMLEVVEHNEADMWFHLKVTTTPADDTDGDAGTDIAGADIKTNLKITDDDGDDVGPRLLANIDGADEDAGDNSYEAVIEYGRFDKLPLEVSIDPNDLADNADLAVDEDPVTAMVGMEAPTPSTNNAPVFVATAPITITGTAGTAITAVDASATDADAGDTLVYSWDVDEALLGLALDTATGEITGTPLKAHDMPHTVTVSDGTESATLMVTVTITAANGTGGPTPVDGKTDEILIQTATDSTLTLGSTVDLGSRFTNPVIPAHGWAVLVRDVEGSNVFPVVGNTWIRSESTSLPDLALFFGGINNGINSGTISLHRPADYRPTVPRATVSDDIVISEIMWGYNGHDPATRACSQWIEFYNTTPLPIDLTGWTIDFHRSLVHESTWVREDLVDIASNAGVTDRNPVHLYHEPWAPKGQSGAYGPVVPFTPLQIVSMFLEINYTQAPGVKHAVIPSGAAGGNWSASVHPQGNLPFGIVGTPGSATVIRIDYAETPISQALIINEIGNSSTDAYDWVEIYNPGTAAVNIKNMMFTTVTHVGGVGKEEILFRFPNADFNIQPGHYVVYAASDPKNDGNDLAAGIDVTKSDIDQRNKGLGSKVGIEHQADNTTAFYRIHSAVKLPNNALHRLYILRSNTKPEHIGAHPDAQKNVVDVIGSLGIRLQNRTPAGWTNADVTVRGLTSTGEAHVRRIYDTTMWPLQWAVNDPGKKHPHAKRVDGDAKALGVGKVYHRNGKNLPNAENHITTPGYTGIGYDRHAEINAENHGTPGYANNAVKSEKSNWNMQVSISEIMLATHESEDAGARIPRAVRLPQWIEIYNSSLTEGVNIGNWYLELRNADSEDLITRDLHGTLRLPSVIIPPNQTILIVSSSGLHSANFPDQRVINLFTNSNARNVFSLVNRNDPVLSQVGFYIQLRDHKNQYVDEVGNLPPSDRRGIEARGSDNFTPVWDLPEMNHPDGPRTSLIRIYDEGIPNDGLMKVAELGTTGLDPLVGWRRAVDTTFRNVPTLSYYGNQRDYGTPGYRGGGPLPVSLSKFRPERLESGDVVIRWVTESELNNAGFNILRSDTRDGDFTQVNTKLIAGEGTTSERTTYEWKDSTAKPNVVYYYQIQDVSLDGQVQTLRVSRLKGNVTPAGKLTTTWGELKALQ